MSFQYSYQPRSRKFFAYILMLIVGGFAGWQMTIREVLPLSLNAEDETTKEEISTISQETDLSLFWLVWAELNKKYVDLDALDSQKMVYGAIKGMVESLGDHYTVYMTPDESKEFAENLEGTLEGIGAELTVEEDGVLMIVTPLKNSPAERAGLKAGDIIVKINEEFAADLSLFEAIMKIRGEKGTSVTLTILREGIKDPFEVTIQRDNIDIESVTVEKLEGGIVYLSVNQFNDKTIEEFKQAVSEMILEQPKGLIIDLRNNGGGYLDIAVDMLSFILPSNSKAVELVTRKGSGKSEVMKTNGAPKLPDVPLVVLINKGSASASEIVAGAVQDHKRGVIMGTTSFGKGTVQEVESFVDGSSIRMTIAKWLTPDGRDINKKGITPDVVQDLLDSDIENEIDTQKNAAIEYLESLK